MINQKWLQPHYEHSCPIVRFYWNNVIKGIIQQIEADKKELILDFGCGTQRLKYHLPRHNIIGYDIIKEYSDITDYNILQPHTIICSHVLEHMEKSQLFQTMHDFRIMTPKYLITVQPTENLISRISNLIGRPEYLQSGLRAVDHKLRINEVHNILQEFYKLQNRHNVLSLSIISKWIPR